MGIGHAPKLDTLNLSKGADFVQSIRLRSAPSYPAGTQAEIVIKDDEEITLASWDGEVVGTKAVFSEDIVSELDAIPHGAKYDLFLIFDDGRIVKHSYGRVVRNENRYPLVPSSITTNYALQFTDTFDRTYVGKYWVPRSARNGVEIHGNGSDANTLGPNHAFFKDAAALWYTPLNTDSFTVSVSMVRKGNGKCTIAVCSDYAMSTWLGVQFETGAEKVRVVKGKTPTTWDAIAGFTDVSNTVATNDTYVVKYNDLSRTITCFKNNSSTALLTWTDSGNVIPNGLGFRYTGLVWNTAFFGVGCEASAWWAKDGV